MAIIPSDFNVALSPNPIKSVIGMNDGNFRLLFSNTSLTSMGYNLTVKITIPNGVSYVTSDIPVTSITENPDGTITLVWLSIKDLAPNELNYPLNITLKADETFRNTDLLVPFDIPLNFVDIEATLDTLPRGDIDIGNVKVTKNLSSSFIPLRYSLTKSAPSKMPKGAGLLSPETSPLWPYTYTLTLENNSREPSTITLIDTLPNGVRYLNNLSVTGPDDLALSSPNIIYPSSGLGGNDFTTIDWGDLTLSTDSINIITFTAAIWDNYTDNGIENSGSRITHLTPLTNIATLDGISGPIQDFNTTKAMDLTIDKLVTPSSTDVGQINNFTLVYKVNQYDSLNNVVIIDTLSDGQTYNVGSSSIAPVNPNPPRNPNGTTTLTWNLGSLNTGYSNSITFSSTTDSNYYLGGPVSAFDDISNSSNIDGVNSSTSTTAPDNSSTKQIISLPSITKNLINYYYKDGSVKPFDVAAPGDLVEFEIIYSSEGLDSTELGVQIDEFAPINMGPVTTSLPITYSGSLGSSFPLITVSPNGLRWPLGDIPGNNLWIATFSIPVANIDFVGKYNNLTKLVGTNSNGIEYSRASQVEVNFGEPNISLNKTVTGPNISAIKAGEIYTYSIEISNPQNSDGNVTDAFEMYLTDVIPTDLLYNGTYSVTGTGTYTPPVFSGQTVSMTISKLAPGESLTLSYTVRVSNSVVSGKSYINTATLQRPYSQPDKSYQFPGDPLTSSTTLKALGITIKKLISPTATKIGDVVTYILQVTVPLGTNAYNVSVSDTFPATNQSFIVNSATKDGVAITPTVNNNIVTFPTIPYVNAISSAVTIVYSFDVRVINGTHISPFIENQIDNARVAWDLDNIGTPATPFTTSATLQVKTPNLTGRKEQRNITTNPQPFTTSNLTYLIGDIIQYRITITNNGAQTAYNSVITDTIQNFLAYNPGTIATTTGTATISGNIITWNIPTLATGASATLTYYVTTLAGIGSGGIISNFANFSYNTNNNGFGITYGPSNTNTVRLTSPNVTISKTPSISQGEIGDDIDYIITFNIPYGTIAYTPLLTDTLPIGQTYIGPATRQEDSGPTTTITPTISGQTISFPQEADVDASLAAKVITYKFKARITSAIHESPFTENQINTSNINWGSTSIGNRINRSATSTVVARTPNITIKKEQRNVTNSGAYTTSAISAIPSDVIYYKFTITSNGASPAYDINLIDLLDNRLDFFSTITPQSTGNITVTGNSINWTIPQLNNGDSATYEFQISIKPGISSGDTIPNIANSNYNSNDVNPIQYSTTSNTTNINIPLISLDKTVDTPIATIGSILNYTLTVSIPSGVSVTNLNFTDVIPSGQSYIPSSFSGTPIPTGTLTVASNQLIYVDSEPSRLGPLTLIYTFSTTVINGNLSSPYTQVKRNIANFSWTVTSSGNTKLVSDYADVTINVPRISILKEQRLLPFGTFTTNTLSGIQSLDEIEYRITVRNIGTSDAYNTVTTDILDSSLNFIEFTGATAGTPIYAPNTITWTINPPIPPGGSEILTFKFYVNPGPAPETTVVNQASSIYKSLPTNTTNLGPSLSNKVAFVYAPIDVDKTVEKNSLFVGDTVNYTVKVTIPTGETAYNIKFTDVLPPEQSYNSNSLRLDGSPIVPESISPLIAPTIPIVVSIPDAVTLTYTFSATINSISNTPQDQQINTASVSWTLTEGSTIPIDTITDTTTVYVTTNNIEIEKLQSNNISGPFVSTPIDTKVGDTIYYKLQITNPNTYSLYNIISVDTLNPLLQILSYSVDSGAIDINDNSLIWAMDTINTGVYTATITAEILPGGNVYDTIPNLFTTTFAVSPDTQDIIYGPLSSNTVTSNLPALKFNKTAIKTEVELGEIITYILSVTIPKGLKAYDVKVSDTLNLKQIYIGNASVDGVIVEDTQAGQVITFPSESYLTPNLEDYVVEFKFDARVVEGNEIPPFTEIQTDNAKVEYAINQEGDPAPTLTATLDIIVNSPNLEVIKSQLNLTQEGIFDVTPIPVNTFDTVRYKFEIINTGASPAYSLVLNDILNPFDIFLNIVDTSHGFAIYDNTTNSIIWTIDYLGINEVCELTFDVICAPGVSSGGSTSNIASYSYNSNLVTPIEFGPIDTNEVIKFYPNISVEKTPNKNNFIIGQIVTYDIYFKVPLGTIAYDIQISDTLHVGQEYNDNLKLNGNSISGEIVNGQSITLPLIPILDASDREIIYHYTFEALITSANTSDPEFIEVQNNTVTVNWLISPTIPADPVVTSTNINVTNSSIELSKLQRNVSKGESFTSDPITGFSGQTIEYSLSITNNGPNTAYNIIVNDLLSNLYSFISVVFIDNGTISHLGGTTNGSMLWTLFQLLPGETATAIFSVKLIDQPTGPIDNFTSGIFSTVAATTEFFQADNSNTVILTPYSPFITINTCSIATIYKDNSCKKRKCK